MVLEFDFVPHDINNIFQNIKQTTAFTRHLLMITNNQNLWNILISIDPYSLCINRNDSIYIVINIIEILKNKFQFYAQEYKVKDYEIEEIRSYDKLLVYLHDRLKNGKEQNNKKNRKNK